MSNEHYLKLQEDFYNKEASKWSLENRDPVVGSYDQHNNYSAYDTLLFKKFDTTNLKALDYGCGPGRNSIRFSKRFKQVDGTDISPINIEKAIINAKHNNVTNANFFVCDGKSLPVEDESYDVVFSVICLQHIASYDVRFSIFKDVFRALRPGGYFCFQMAFGGRYGNVVEYYSNEPYHAETPGGFDVAIRNENDLYNDLINKVGFVDYLSDFTEPGPGDNHRNWIWVQVRKP